MGFTIMRPSYLRAASAFGVALALGLSVQAAQPASGGASPASSDAAAGEAAVTADDAETLLLKARQMQVSIAQVADGLSESLREARENKDVVREVCLDDKLNQADVAAETAQDRVSSMVAATAAGDLATVQRDFVVVSALSESADELRATGDRCLGEEQSKPMADGKPLELTIDPLIPTQETTGGAFDLPPFLLPPSVMIQPQLATSRVM
jgi:hypothetical protein